MQQEEDALITRSKMKANGSLWFDVPATGPRLKSVADFLGVPFRYSELRSLKIYTLQCSPAVFPLERPARASHLIGGTDKAHPERARVAEDCV